MVCVIDFSRDVLCQKRLHAAVMRYAVALLYSLPHVLGAVPRATTTTNDMLEF
jgi:hypothetical protein